MDRPVSIDCSSFERNLHCCHLRAGFVLGVEGSRANPNEHKAGLCVRFAYSKKAFQEARDT